LPAFRNNLGWMESRRGSRLRKLKLLLVLGPLVELLLLIELGRAFDALHLLVYLLLTAAAGIFIVRVEGLRTFARLGGAILNRGPPQPGALEGVLRLLGGALLVVPGPLSDLAGLALLVPAIRRWTVRAIRRRLQIGLSGGWVEVEGGAGNGRPPGFGHREDLIDAEIVEDSKQAPEDKRELPPADREPDD
jgi:UPF0716 protein FxsA